jgi:hypothetical protein
MLFLVPYLLQDGCFKELLIRVQGNIFFFLLKFLIEGLFAVIHANTQPKLYLHNMLLYGQFTGILILLVV